MRALIQRVTQARVRVGNQVVGQIGNGMVVFLGVGKNDTQSDVDFIAGKIPRMRIFDDDRGKMNLSLKDVQGEILLISQFTLYGNCRKGLRPSYDEAASPEEALRIYRQVSRELHEQNLVLAEGIFGAMMQVELCNNGPVTILLDSKERRNP